MEAAAAVLIVLAAIVARFLSLQTQPGGLYPDEAAEGLSAQSLLSVPGYHPVFFNSDGGREALYAYIVAAVFKVFGSSVLTLRGAAAAVGVAGVVATYAAVRRFGRGPALMAMAWTAGSLWMIAVSRDGFRNILTVLVGAAALAALLRWGDRPSRWTAVAAGAVTALGFWSYQPLKLLPVLVILWLVWMRARQPERFRAVRGTWRWATVAFLVVVAPMVYTAITDFSGYFGRAAFVSVFNSGSMSQDSYPAHILKTLGMFFVTGDPNPRHDVAALPLLGPILVVPLLLGIWHCWRQRDDHGYALILLGLPVFLIPPLIANEGGAPHFLRSLGLEPYVAACIGLGCVEGIAIAQRLAQRFAGWQRSVTLTRLDGLRDRGHGAGDCLGGDLSQPPGRRSLCGFHVRRRRPGRCRGRQPDRRRRIDAAHPRQLRRDGRPVPRCRAVADHRRADDEDHQRGGIHAHRRPVAD